jgi:alanyl aminopeptidase
MPFCRGLLSLLLLLPCMVFAAEDVPAGKLSSLAEPLHYWLAFTLDPAVDGYRGETRIRVRLNVAADHIWLHGRDLDVQKVSVSDAKGKAAPANYQQRNNDGVALVSFGRMLPPQEIELSLSFRAKYNTLLEGVSKIKVASDAYLITQMEPVSARFAFPGFDEPRFKTPFDITLTVPKAQVALANTRQLGEKVSNDAKWKTLTFATTLPLPTYLVAFAVGPWDVVEGKPIAPNAERTTALPLRAIASRGNGKRLSYVLEQAPNIIAYYEKYTGQPYPYDKLDLLGAPDFGAGAMENAGLIIFRDTLLLLDQNSPAERYRAAFTVMAHEIAHQWFGDLVTAPWWDDIWLNEAFATWAEGKGTLALQPEFHGDMEHLEARLGAMRTDSLNSARRIRQPITNQGDIENAFDGITYQKGASVLGMFESWLGPEKFRSGIQKYLAGHKFRSGSSDDMVDVVAAASDQGERLKLAMRSFLDQPGTPRIRTEVSCTDGQAQVKLTQSRYLPLGSKADSKALWGVPVCLRFGHADKNEIQCVLLDKTEASFPIAAGGCPEWTLPNADASGYYRFSISVEAFTKLAAHLASLSGPEQLIFADAVSSAFYRGELDAAALLDSLPALAASPVPQVATALLDDVEWIREYLVSESQRARFDARIGAIFLPRLQQLGYVRKTAEASNDTALRVRLVKFLALRLQVPEVRAALLAQGRKALALDGGGKAQLGAANADLLASVLGVTVQENGAAAIKAMYAELEINHDANSRYAMLAALGASQDTTLAEQARNYALGASVQLSEMRVLFDAQNQEPENRAAFWRWFQVQFDAVLQRTPAFAQGRMPSSVSDGRCSIESADELDKFFRPHVPQITGGARALAQAQESIGLCSALRTQQKPPVLQQWLDQQGAMK